MEASTSDDSDSSTAVRVTILPGLDNEKFFLMHWGGMMDVEKEMEVISEAHNVETNDADAISVDSTLVDVDILKSDLSMYDSPFDQFTENETGSDGDVNQNEVSMQLESIHLQEGTSGSSSSSSEYHVNAQQSLAISKIEEIADRCLQLQSLMKCKVYFRAQFTPPSGVGYGCSIGKYFRVPETEKEASLNVSALLQPEPDSVGSTVEPCSHCKKQVVIGPDLKIIETQWAQCHGGDDQPCSTRIHTDCLGFPGAKILPDYYCPKHIIYGRRNEKVNSYYP